MATARRTATNENVSVYGDARQYTDLAAWESDTDIDMVTATQSEVLECYDDLATFTDQVLMNAVDGFTNASYFRIIRPAGTRGVDWEGHDGTPNNGVNFSYSSGTVLQIAEDFSQIQDIIATNSGGMGFRTDNSVHSDTKYIGCIAYDCSGVGFYLYGPNVLSVDCIAMNGSSVGFQTGGRGGSPGYFYNCTAKDNSGIGYYNYIGNNDGSDGYFRNCLGDINSGDDFYETGSGDTTYSYNCASSDDTADDFTGSGNQIEQTFTYVASGSEDFHLAFDDAGARNLGQDLSGDSFFDFDDDIDGVVIIAPWDIGFDHSPVLRQIIVDTDSSYPGYDYSVLQTAESTEQDDISRGSGSDEYVVFECYATSGSADAYVNFDGWTTAASNNYIEVTGMNDVDEFHNGVWDSSKYTIYHTGAVNLATLRNYEEHFRVIGLQIWMNNATGTRRGFLTASLSASDSEITVSHCLVRGNGGSSQNEYCIGLESGASGQIHKIYNNIVFDVSTAATSYGIYVNASSTSTAYVYNNTVIGGTYGVYRNAGTQIPVNNLCQDQTSQGVGSSAGLNTANGYNIIEDPTLVLQSLGGTGTDLKTGTATSYGANKLNDSGGGLSVAVVGSVVGNTTDNTYAYVTVVDSDIQLTLSADIFDTGNETYRVSSNIYGNPDFQSGTYLLATEDILAMFAGTNLYADANNPVTDDVLGNSRGASTTDNFDIGAHHSLEYSRVVDPDSGAGFDYTSLDTCESNEQADLQVSALNKISVATCRSTGGTADTTAFTIDGWTTTVANYIKIWTDPTESYRHAGIYPSGNKFRFEYTGATFGITLMEDYIRFEGIPFSHNVSSAEYFFSIVGTNILDLKVSKCILKDGGGAALSNGFFRFTAQSGGVVNCWNNIIYDTYYGFRMDGGDANSVRLYNNTCVDCTYGFRGASETVLKNNIAVGGTDNFYGSSYSTLSRNNVTDLDPNTDDDLNFGVDQKTGTTTDSASFKLMDSGGGLSSIVIGSLIEAGDDDTYVTAIDSDIQLSVNDNIFSASEAYTIRWQFYGNPTFQNAGADEFLLGSSDTVAKDKGVDLSTDADGFLSFSDDILETTRS